MLTRKDFLIDSTLVAGALLSKNLPFNAEAANKENAAGADNCFLHGVASGDPNADKIIIWTRVSGITETTISVDWVMAADDACTKILQKGTAHTTEDADYTVKVDVDGLKSGTYYYQFVYKNCKSPVGRTKITGGNYAPLAFAVVSCSNYAAGYYNALGNIAKRNDLDAVIHLGDYIYESTTRSFDNDTSKTDDEYELIRFNRTKNWWLHYYRLRYAISRLDPDLQAAHLVHPFITIWDDHEIANNAWKGGSMEHHEERDGEWETRKSAAKQAYSEWIPIRGDAEKIYRSIKFGNLAELILLDTRIEGRDKQIYDSTDPALLVPERTILGKEQQQWALDKLKNSTCQWKLFANQVIFSRINIQWAAMGGRFNNKVIELENTLLDYWEGYPAERDKVIQHISQHKIADVVILSASMHCALAFDVIPGANKLKGNHKGKGQTAAISTGSPSIAVEFAAPSITSANFDETAGKFYAGIFESMINRKLPAPMNYNPNPHMKFADLQRHGYFILQLTKEKAEASFYFVDELTKKSGGEKLAAVLHTKTNESRLQSSGITSPG